MKEKKKITILSSVIVLLCISLSILIYLCFFSDKYFSDLGYSKQQIKLIHQYQLEDEIKQYNQSLIYALNSENFDEKNIRYYLLFNSQIDYTDSINRLANIYTLAELKQIMTVLDYDQTVELIEYEKINNISAFTQIVEKGYSVKDATSLANNLSDDNLEKFLAIPTLEKPEVFTSLLEKGYQIDTIINLYNKVGADSFIQLSKLKYFSSLDDLLSDDSFNFKLLARYLMYIEQHNVSSSSAIYHVATNDDYIEDPDFSSFYDNVKEVTDTSLTMLVNKSNKLSQSFVPENLEEVSSDYRNSNQSLQKEALDAFVEMSDACYQAIDRRILVYSGYRSYEAEDSLYNGYIISSGDGDSSKVDSFADRAGHSEHQSGLAIDVCQKGYSYNEFNSCLSSDWMYEYCYDYGYILRYPSSRAFLTGHYFTSYHYRYVGVEVAKMIQQYDWTLEEYCYLFASE